MRMLLRYAYGVVPGATVATLLLALASAGAAAVLNLLIGRVVGALPGVLDGGPVGGSFVALFVAFGIVFVLGGVLPEVLSTAQWMLAQSAAYDLWPRLASPLLAPRRIAHLDDPVVLDEVERARGGHGWAIEASLGRVIGLFSARVMLIGQTVLVGALFNWVVAVVLAGAVLVTERRYLKKLDGELEAYQGMTEDQRRAQYLFELGTDEGAKELPVFGLHGWLVDRYRTEWTAAMREIWRTRRSGALRGMIPLAGYLLLFAAAILYVALRAGRGDLGVAQTATVLPAMLTLAVSVSPYTALQVRRGVTAYRAMLHVPVLIDERHPETGVSAADLSQAPGQLIRFEQVGFRYPGADRDVFDGLELELRSGEALALVGINGAGKSTLVKLLTGAYQPTRGRITVDGVDLATLSPAGLEIWQRQIAAIAQDFVRFPLSVRDNVGFGRIERYDDEAGRVRAARRAGVDELIDGLPLGWDTVLDKAWQDGADLSGGEWQRIALARALFAVQGGAKVLVLDEPAAALDVRAEARLVAEYLDLTRGLTSLIISHRFSVVRDAHRICVLDGGRIVETGTHSELLELGGRYAAMFRLQAERYLGGPSDA
ncbi:ATP-binding cassette domain-containing protein [Kribbella sp. NPDC051620]|uniref:ATP-binding cassette domain-containing protein n=1 Tax=Kribbella sp. NPDC051620 TaxID=3364120 RepID=UPI0037A06454